MKFVTLALLIQASNAGGGATSPPASALRHADGRVPAAVTAVRVTDAPHLDGRLDDDAWRRGQPVTDFMQVDPVDGQPPTERTEVRVVYTSDALYVGARMFDDDPSAIASRMSRRDQFNSSDLFTVVVDSYHDHRTAFRFRVNPAGVREDAITSNDQGFGDEGWDPVWEAATAIDSLGWVAEMRIPFSQLRFADTDAEPVWGINFTRIIFRSGEFDRWNWSPNTEQGFASLFGHLLGLEDIPQPRRVEVAPYTVATSDFKQGADPNSPFDDGSRQTAAAGLDLKYGVTSNLTLDATINPDFGQVEADPAVVNLTAFETFFSERRPFFVEGSQIFQFGAGGGGFIFGAPQLFYSRRIGHNPSRFASASGGYADNPVNTTILGAAKLSGQTAGWSIGVLDALTAREYARIQRPDGSRTTEPVEPLTNYGVVSLRRDRSDGAFGLGVVATGVQRDLRDPAFEFLRSSAYTGGLDFYRKFDGNTYVVNGTVSASSVAGSTTAITLAQRSSARYFQRPDQSYVSVDPAATSLRGLAASLTAGKVSGNWTYGADFFMRSPAFEANDAGFETQTDRIFTGLRLSRRWLKPGKVFRSANLDATTSQEVNFGGTRVFRVVFLGANVQLLNYWSLFLGGSANQRAQSDKLTRGGPLMQSPGQWSLQGFLQTDYRKPVTASVSGYYARNEYGGWGDNLRGSIDIRPTSAVTVRLSPSYSASRSLAGYVTQVEDATAAATFGRRYVFATLRQRSLDLTIRTDVSLTPDLSIQLYAQPFVAAGDYEGFRELAAPQTFDFLHYGQDGPSTLAYEDSTRSYIADPDGTGGAAPAFTFSNPDFLLRSLRGNLVLRWAYRPGSTLFLVWNHGRSMFSTDPTFHAIDELRNIFGDPQENTLLVKLNYWLSL